VGRQGPNRAALAIGVGLGLLLPIAPDPADALGNAGLHVRKTVASSSVRPVLSVTFSVDRATAIPGVTLTYSGSVASTGATLGFKGLFFRRAARRHPGDGGLFLRRG